MGAAARGETDDDSLDTGPAALFSVLRFDPLATVKPDSTSNHHNNGLTTSVMHIESEGETVRENGSIYSQRVP